MTRVDGVVRRRQRLGAFVVLLLGAASAAGAEPNADRGAKLHEVCLQCHGTELYVPPRRKIDSMQGLRKETERWSRSYNPKLTKAEVDDLVAYLNRDFYKFGK